MDRRPTKEPISKPWIWILMVLITLAAIPWYLPKETIGFAVFGVPYWVLISVALILVLCGYVSWLCFTQWDLVEAEEERASSGEAKDGRPGAGAE